MSLFIPCDCLNTCVGCSTWNSPFWCQGWWTLTELVVMTVGLIGMLIYLEYKFNESGGEVSDGALGTPATHQKNGSVRLRTLKPDKRSPFEQRWPVPVKLDKKEAKG
jgi:hypothetical protein